MELKGIVYKISFVLPSTTSKLTGRQRDIQPRPEEILEWIPLVREEQSIV
jgi:hypothetical protein